MRLRVGLVLAVLLLAGCGGDGVSEAGLPVLDVIVGRGDSALTIVAEVASTATDRANGLMNRPSLGPNAGMLFVFREPVRVPFYMKNTLIPLDIAFIRQGRVSEIHSMVPCRVEDCPLTTPSASYEMALEVAAGTFARAGIEPGAPVQIPGTLPKPS